MLNPVALAQPARVGYIDECTFTCIAEQAALSDAGDKNVREAVIVVIADGDAHAVEFDIESRMRGHISECAVMIVVVETQGTALLFRGRANRRR